MPSLLNDARYTIGLEYCGYKNQKFVVRFCGDMIANAETKEEAKKAQIIHSVSRTSEEEAKSVIESYNDFVLLIALDSGYRVCYGAHVEDFKNIAAAGLEFENCKAHYKKAGV